MRTTTLIALCATLTMLSACSDDSEEGGEGYTSNGDDAEDGDTVGDTGTGTETETGDTEGDGGTPIEPDNMIDNFEDGDGALIPNGGRQGYWYIFNDESEGSVQTPATDMVLPEEGGAVGTSLALHTTGTGFAEWGGGIGLDLNNEGGEMGEGNGVKMTYDASAFTGIVLRAKGNAQIRASVQIEDTIPPEEGGTCAADCDPHGKVLLLSDEWQEFTLTFDQLNQEGWGTPAVWDASKIVGIQFKASKDTDFDFWVDEVGFY